MNKKKVGIIASACATCAVCASMIVGSTYALFTSNDKVDISVTAGTVNVTADLGTLKTYSKGVAQENGNWENGGKATVMNKEVVLENITPGDSVEIPVSITNNSNVEILYNVQVALNSEDKLAEGLEVSINGGVEKSGIINYTSAWMEYEEGAAVTVTVSLPLTAGNEYMLDENGEALSTTVGLAIGAVQANGATAGEGEVFVRKEKVSTPEAFLAALNDVNVPYITLENDITVSEQTNVTKNLTLDLNGKALNISTANDGIQIDNGANLKISNGAMNVTAPKADKNGIAIGKISEGNELSLDNVKVKANCYGVSIFSTSKVTINNSTIVSTGAVAVSTNASEKQETQVEITDSKLVGYACGILFNVNGKLNVTNTKVYGVNNAILLRAGNAVITDCTLQNNLQYNTAEGAELGSTQKFSDNLKGATFNKFYNDNSLWGDGNNGIPIDTVVVGTKNGNYENYASCKFVDTTIVDGFVGNKDTEFLHYLIYAINDTSKEGTIAEVTYDKATADKSGITDGTILAQRDATISQAE